MTVLTNPIWVLKTRLQLQLGGGMRRDGHGGGGVGRYAGMAGAVGHIWRAEGLAGFYKGIWPSLMLVTQGALQVNQIVQSKKRRDEEMKR